MTLTTETSQKIPGFIVTSYGTWWPAPDATLESRNSGIYSAEYCKRRPENMPPNMNDVPWHENVSAEWRLQDVPIATRYEHQTIARARNWQSLDIKRPWTLFAFFLIAFSYGGLHCLAWNSTFPSFVQQSLWRITSVGVMSTGFLILVCSVLLNVVNYRLDRDLQHAFGNGTTAFPTTRWRILVFKGSRPILGIRLRYLLRRCR